MIKDHRAAPGGVTGHSHPVGTTGTAAGAGAMGAAAEHGHHSHGTGTTGKTTAGPHNSNIANEVDPRVDSDRCTFLREPSYNY